MTLDRHQGYVNPELPGTLALFGARAFLCLDGLLVRSPGSGLDPFKAETKEVA